MPRGGLHIDFSAAAAHIRARDSYRTAPRNEIPQKIFSVSDEDALDSVSFLRTIFGESASTDRRTPIPFSPVAAAGRILALYAESADLLPLRGLVAHFSPRDNIPRAPFVFTYARSSFSRSLGIVQQRRRFDINVLICILTIPVFPWNYIDSRRGLRSSLRSLKLHVP